MKTKEETPGVNPQTFKITLHTEWDKQKNTIIPLEENETHSNSRFTHNNK